MFKNEKTVKKIADSRISRLYELAEFRTMKKDADSKRLAKRYVSIIRKLSSHYKVNIPKQIKSRLCSKCNNVLIPGVNCTKRLSGKFITYKCECGHETHSNHGYKKRKIT